MKKVSEDAMDLYKAGAVDSLDDWLTA
jgi:hypothetical protein